VEISPKAILPCRTIRITPHLILNVKKHLKDVSRIA